MSQDPSHALSDAAHAGADAVEAAAEQGLHVAEDASRVAVDEAVHLATEAPHVAEEVLAQVDHTIDRIRTYNEQIIESAASSSHKVLDTYEQTLRTVLEFQISLAEASQIEWVNAMARAQAQFMLEVSNFYTKAARDLLG